MPHEVERLYDRLLLVGLVLVGAHGHRGEPLAGHESPLQGQGLVVGQAVALGDPPEVASLKRGWPRGGLSGKQRPREHLGVLRDGGPRLAGEVDFPLLQVVEVPQRPRLERIVAGQHDVQHHADGPHVHRRGRVAQHRLGRHVQAGATDELPAQVLRRLVRVEGDRADDIHERHLECVRVRKDEIRELEVPMHQAAAMYGADRLQHLAGDVRDPLLREVAGIREPVGDIGAVQLVHDKEH
mmetsp:Transcript_126389/g.353923  ORF Transcript_126389/g.353923 Transcript_126389/m.353923 type:complete len:240 (-) Transcript_126389:401-1120(-)